MSVSAGEPGSEIGGLRRPHSISAVHSNPDAAASSVHRAQLGNTRPRTNCRPATSWGPGPNYSLMAAPGLLRACSRRRFRSGGPLLRARQPVTCVSRGFRAMFLQLCSYRGHLAESEECFFHCPSFAPYLCTSKPIPDCHPVFHLGQRGSRAQTIAPPRRILIPRNNSTVVLGSGASLLSSRDNFDLRGLLRLLLQWMTLCIAVSCWCCFLLVLQSCRSIDLERSCRTWRCEYGGHTLRSFIEAPLITREVLPETYFLLVIMAADAQAGPFLQFQGSCLCGTL
jgi:hypothetical protein